MRRIITDIYDYLHRHGWMTWTALVSVLAICIFSASSLHFEEDIYAFLPETADTQRYSFVTENFSIANEIVINIAMADTSADTDTELLIRVADEVCDSLSKGIISKHIKKVTSSIDSREISSISSFIASHLPYYLDPDDYEVIRDKIAPENVSRQLLIDREMLGSVAGTFLRGVIQTDPLFFSTDLLKGLDSFRYNNHYLLVDGHIFTSDSTEAVITVGSFYPSSETAHNKELINALEELSHSISATYGDAVTISSFGAAYIAVSNAERIKKDSIITISVSVVLILLILTLAYRNLRVTLSLAATLAFGFIFSIGICGAVTDSVSVIAIGMGSVIIGIAANYPLHFLDHRFQGYDNRETIRDIVKPLTIGNLTTVGAFMSLLLISSGAMHDLGLFAAMILVGTILFVLVFLPHILKMKSSGQTREDSVLIFSGLSRIHFERNGWIMITMVILTVLFFKTGEETGFDADMNRINYMTPSQKEKMAALMEQENSSNETLYVFSEGDDLNGALEEYEKARIELLILRRDSLIEEISGISGYLPSMALQKQRTASWNEFWKEHSDDVSYLLDRYASQAGFKSGVFGGFTEMITSEYTPVDIPAFGPVKNLLADNYIISTPERTMILTPLHVRRENLQAVRSILSERLPESSFAFSQGSMIQEIVDSLSSDFDLVLTLCSILVFVFLLISFSSAELAIIAFIPLTVSWIWILGIMGVLGMDFNIINIILATFIFGMGDDYTIFITEGLMDEYRTGRSILTTFKNTVLLSAVLIFIGIGVLVFAKHPSLNQLGLVTVIGMFCVVVMAFIIPPFFFRLLTEKRGVKREYPVTFRNFGKTLFCLSYMAAATSYLAVEGFFLLTLAGRSPRHRYIYHRSICRLSRFAIIHLPGVEHDIDNPKCETFSKTSIIVSNHQSHLDLMALLSLSDKIIVLTNRWVHDFPFYAAMVRYADFLPVEGLASGESIPKLRELVNEGYSIAVFPEGTRSVDGTVGKFHKGAFMLSETFGLDIIPVVLHGFSDILPKNDLLMRRGSAAVKIMDRITCDDASRMAEGRINRTLAVTSHIRAIMVRELELMSRKYRTAAYFRDRVLSLYLYKGDGIYSKVRHSLDESGCFGDQIDHLPYSGEVEIVDNGYGERILTASMARPDLKIMAVCGEETSEILRNIAGLMKNIVIEE